MTIAIFQTGRILFSGIHEDYKTPLIKWFLNLVHEVKDDIETINNSSFSLVKYLRPSYLYAGPDIYYGKGQKGIKFIQKDLDT